LSAAAAIGKYSIRQFDHEAEAAMEVSGRDDAGLIVAEMHHRFGNSFQVIAAMARQWHATDDAGCREAMLADLSNRMEDFAAMHRMLSGAPPGRDIAQHWRDMCRTLIGAFGRHDRVSLSLDEAISDEGIAQCLTLIVAELVTNALKHSLRLRPAGCITIVLRRSGSNMELAVSDDASTPVDERVRCPSRFADALARSLGGRAFVADRNGYTACVLVPIKRCSGSSRAVA
jgi:two-component sensor histidine kinase